MKQFIRKVLRLFWRPKKLGWSGVITISSKNAERVIVK